LVDLRTEDGQKYSTIPSTLDDMSLGAAPEENIRLGFSKWVDAATEFMIQEIAAATERTVIGSRR
jgi:hypothetical protein